jgi:hypothetical protein
VNPFRKLSQVIKQLKSKDEKVMSLEIIGRYGRLIRGILKADRINQRWSRLVKAAAKAGYI